MIVDWAERDGPLRLRQCREVDVRIGHALADPLVLDRPAAHAGDTLLVQLVIEERAIVRDHKQQRDPVVYGRPQGGHPHQEVTVAADRHRQAAGSLQRQRRAHRDARSAADATATIAADEIQGVAERPPGAVPRQRQVKERDLPLAERCPQCTGQVLDAKRARRLRCRRGGGCKMPGARSSAHRSSQIDHGGIGIGSNEQVDWGKALVVHAPAVVHRVIERDLNNPGFAARGCGAQRPRQVDPVETEDDVGTGYRFQGIRRWQ